MHVRMTSILVNSQSLDLRHWSTIVEIHANCSQELRVIAAGAIDNMPHLRLLDLSGSSQLRCGISGKNHKIVTMTGLYHPKPFKTHPR